MRNGWRLEAYTDHHGIERLLIRDDATGWLVCRMGDGETLELEDAENARDITRPLYSAEEGTEGLKCPVCNLIHAARMLLDHLRETERTVGDDGKEFADIKALDDAIHRMGGVHVEDTKT
tara:strand:- start:1043 stop:1402 length:360 start_codon:yes stop_codon:yes gene_type:complete